MTYATCLYDSFWWVGLVTQVDVEQGDAKVHLCSHMGHVNEDSCYVSIKNILSLISSGCISKLCFILSDF